jgi:hypothetical protein
MRKERVLATSSDLESPVCGDQDAKTDVESNLRGEAPCLSLAGESGKMEGITSAVNPTIIKCKWDRSFEADQILRSRIV